MDRVSPQESNKLQEKHRTLRDNVLGTQHTSSAKAVTLLTQHHLFNSLFSDILMEQLLERAEIYKKESRNQLGEMTWNQHLF